MHQPDKGTEKIPIPVHSAATRVSRAIAREIAQLIRTKADRGQRRVLGSAIGSTPAPDCQPSRAEPA